VRAVTSTRSTEVPKRTIARQDYYKVVGLLALAAEHNRAVALIERTLAELLDEPSDMGSYGAITNEVLAQNPDADGLLRSMNIDVGDA
jgi:hypothetical protein